VSSSCLAAECSVAAGQNFVMEEAPGVDSAGQMLELHSFAAGQEGQLAEGVVADLDSPAVVPQTQPAEMVAADPRSLLSGTVVVQVVVEAAVVEAAVWEMKTELSTVVDQHRSAGRERQTGLDYFVVP